MATTYGLMKKASAYAIIEATAGIDPNASPGTPDANTQLLITGQPTIKKIPDKITRDARLTNLSSLGFTYGSEYVEVQLTTEARGRGAVPTAASPIRDNPLLIANMQTPTYVAGTSATYNYSSALASAKVNATVCLYLNLHGILHLVRYGRVKTKKTTLEFGKVGKVDWTLWGIQTPVTVSDMLTSLGIQDEAQLADSVDNFALKPFKLTGCTVTLDGFAAIIRRLEMTQENSLEVSIDGNNTTGIDAIIAGDRKITGVVQLARPLRAEKDFYYLAQSGTTGVISADCGATGVGNRIIYTYGAAQWEFPDETASAGGFIRDFTMGWEATRVGSGDDEGTEAYRA